MDNEDDQSTFTSHLRTIIILAARNSPSGDIDIAAVDQIVETTIDFLKNILEQLPNESQRTVDDLFNIIRVRLFTNIIRWIISSFLVEFTFDTQSKIILFYDGNNKSSLICIFLIFFVLQINVFISLDI